MKQEFIALCTCIIFFAVMSSRGHTHDETNAVSAAALARAASYYDDLPEGSPPDDDPPPDTWRGFLGTDTNGWSFADKMAAFDCYLSTLATTLLASALVVPTMPPPFIFDPTWNAAKIVRRGQPDPNLHVVCSVDNIPLFIRIR